MGQQTGPAGQKPAHGVQKQRIRSLLADAEPRRRFTLGASLCFVIALAGCAAIFMGGGRSYLIAMLVAGFIAAALWPLCNRMWRYIAIGVLAPAMGEGWGQKEFASGWSADGLGRIVDGLLSAGGPRTTAWRSAGVYRDISYRLREETVRRKRTGDSIREVHHVLVAEISVPHPFSGTVELVPKAGVVGSRINDVLRMVEGSKERRQSVDPQFDAVFETLVSGNAPLDELLVPNVQSTLLNLAARHKEGRFVARFENGWFTLRLPIRRLTFASAHLLKPLPELENEAGELWWDLTLPHRLIDAFSGDYNGPLR